MFNSLIDYVHKSFSPQTYDCNLCLITYKGWDENNKWSTYIESLPIKVSFLYKDSVGKYVRNNKAIKLPVLLFMDQSRVLELISPSEINEINNIDELIDVCNSKLKDIKIIK